MESDSKGCGHFQGGTLQTFPVIPASGLLPVRAKAALGCDRIQRGRSLSGEGYSSNMALGYYMNKVTGAVSAVGRMPTNTVPYTRTVKTLVYKRCLCFLSYLTLKIILPDRSDLCHTHEVPEPGEVTELSQGALLSRSPVVKHCPEPSVPAGTT